MTAQRVLRLLRSTRPAISRVDTEGLSLELKGIFSSTGNVFDKPLRDDLRLHEISQCVESLARTGALDNPAISSSAQTHARAALDATPWDKMTLREACALLKSISAAGASPDPILKAKVFDLFSPPRGTLQQEVGMVISLSNLNTRHRDTAGASGLPYAPPLYLSLFNRLASKGRYGEAFGDLCLPLFRSTSALLKAYPQPKGPPSTRVEKILGTAHYVRRAAQEAIISKRAELPLSDLNAVLLSCTPEESCVKILCESANTAAASLGPSAFEKPDISVTVEYLCATARLNGVPSNKLLKGIHDGFPLLEVAEVARVIASLSGLAKRGAVPPKVPVAFLKSFERQLEEGRSDLESGDGQSLANLLHSLAGARVRDGILLSRVVEQLKSPAVAMSLSSRHCGDAMWAFATLRLKSEACVVIESAAASSQTVSSVTPLHAARIAWASVKLQMTTRFVRQVHTVLIQPDAPVAPGFLLPAAPCDEITLIWAFVKSKVWQPKQKSPTSAHKEAILRAASQKVMARSLPQEDLTHLPKLTWAFSAMRCDDRRTLRHLSNYLAENVADMPVDHLAMHSRAIASIGGLFHGDFFEAVLRTTAKEIRAWRMSADVCCQMLWAFSRLQHQQDAATKRVAADGIVNHLLPQLRDLSEEQLLGAVRSVARLGVAFPPAMQDRAVATASSVAPHKHQQTLIALEKLGCTAPYLAVLRERLSSGSLPPEAREVIEAALNKFSDARS